MDVLVEVSKNKNGIDFTVKVMKPNAAPQIFNNLPVMHCLIACKCSDDEMKNAKIIEC